MTSITAHCLVRNEENFIQYAIKSVVGFVDKVIIFDTGSTDKTVQIIQELLNKYPGKIIFEEKGACDKARHTQLRREMLERTTTDWFMILDGDEVWTERALREASQIIAEGSAEVIETYFYECVGDIFHTHYKSGYKTIRFAKCKNVTWGGNYNTDNLISVETNKVITQVRKVKILKNKFWHLTHLLRSSKDGKDYSSGGTRAEKRQPTYFLVGRRIKEPVPEIFDADLLNLKLSNFKSFLMFFIWITRKLTKNLGR